jgi:2-polyprenyl-6-methoxyphenol hydroxylase-like FAD-dependent oxidoreductase
METRMDRDRPGPGRILIAGGGIAGLTLATALCQRGLSAEIVERDAEGTALGAGIAVQPNGMRVLRALGSAAAVEQAGAHLRRWLFRDQRGELLCEIDLEALWNRTGPFIGIARAELQETLLAGAAVPRRLGTWVRSLSQDGRRVWVEFGDGATGQYDLVVGADGILSTVRQAALGSAPPVYDGQMVWRSLAALRPPEPDAIQFWLGDGCFFGLCPAGGARTYGFGNVTGPRLHDALEGRRERLRHRFAGFAEPVRDYLGALESDASIHCGPIEWLELDHWHTGRVVLIGDAAHASSPMMGQGGSMAMEDAWVLAETLPGDADVEVALDRFVARRRSRVDWVQQGSRAVGEMLRVPPEARNAVLRERGRELLRDRFQPLTAQL